MADDDLTLPSNDSSSMSLSELWGDIAESVVPVAVVALRLSVEEKFGGWTGR
jgi:hypothetical protein